MKDIHSILIIGSGPIVIGQGAEFDYAGTQACIALKEEGYRVILVNNNPATIMTDTSFADQIYFEPLTADTLEKIIIKEKPDGIIASFGGQTGLNLAFQLSEQQVFKKYGVKLLGSSITSIKKGEDRESFRQLMKELEEPIPESAIVHSVNEALQLAQMVGYPLIVRPAYTLGGSGSGIAKTEEQLIKIIESGLAESPIHQCLVERSIAGFKEIEFEVMRDKSNQCKIICHMENFDPVGIHTGDSIVVAPSQTISAEEYEILKKAAIKIVSTLEIIGACNIQFALHPNNKSYYVIEVNPRVSRSSALASKATSFPIAKIAAKLAAGYTFKELGMDNKDITIQHCVVKIPKWPFDKFPSIDRRLGTMMKATGEVMGIEKTFEKALMKAIQSLESKKNDLMIPHLQKATSEELWKQLIEQTDERLFILFELIRRDFPINDLHELTKIDLYFLEKLQTLILIEREIIHSSFEKVSKEQLYRFKETGFSDRFLANIWNCSEIEIRKKRQMLGIMPAFNIVKNEMQFTANYFYSAYSGKNEQLLSNRKKVIIIGSGPIRIGQGIEFDYCTVHGVFAAKEEKFETIMINNNPETVSTDYSIANKLYFEPLTAENIMNVMEAERTKDCIIQFGGQTAINLAKQLEQYGANILGTTSNVIDLLEDRKLFYDLLDELNIPHLDGKEVNDQQSIISAVKEIGFPVLLRPSFVIGGQQMEIINNNEELHDYLQKGNIPFPLLVDKFLSGKEAEIDLVTDGKYIISPLVIEHIEKTGVHSGDSMALLPSQSFSPKIKKKIYEYGKRICQYLQYKGLMNIQYIVKDDDVYVLEVNPRASRTVPIVSKITNIPLVQIATKILLGKYNLSKFDEEKNFLPIPFVTVKYPVFSNYALKGLDLKLSAEMRSTGEGICISSTVEEALRKVFHQEIKKNGKIIVQEKLNPLYKFYDANVFHEKDHPPTENNVTVYFNRGKTAEDIKKREEAIKKRITIFSELETLNAFLTSLHVKDFSVKTIEDWHLFLREDVAVK